MIIYYSDKSVDDMCAAWAARRKHPEAVLRPMSLCHHDAEGHTRVLCLGIPPKVFLSDDIWVTIIDNSPELISLMKYGAHVDGTQECNALMAALTWKWYFHGDHPPPLYTEFCVGEKWAGTYLATVERTFAEWDIAMSVPLQEPASVGTALLRHDMKDIDLAKLLACPAADARSRTEQALRREKHWETLGQAEEDAMLRAARGLRAHWGLR